MSKHPYLCTGGIDDRFRRRKGASVWITVFALLGIGVLLVLFLLPAIRTARPAARRNSCINKLKQIALALHNYADAYKALPPAYTVDADGRPLHSWRTLILPYLEETTLYKKIDLSKPWDDPANAESFKTEVDAYRCPEFTDQENQTTYLAVIAPGSCLRPTEPTSLSEITDKTSQTLLMIEVPLDKAVPWMSPQDADEAMVMAIGPGAKLAHHGVMIAAMADGSVRTFEADLPAAERRAMITRAGNDPVSEDY